MTVDFIEQDSAHIESFINGFESIIKQKSRNGFVDIGGCETYTTGVMLANGVKFQDTYDGFENFIAEGIKKLWEMVSSFFKGIWNFFFGSEKTAAKSKVDADDLLKTLKEHGNIIDKSLGKNYTDLDKLSGDLKKDAEASKLIDNAVKRIEKVLSYSPISKDSNNGHFIGRFRDYQKNMVGLIGNDFPRAATDKLARRFGDLTVAAVDTRFNQTRASSIVEMIELLKPIITEAEDTLKEIDRTVQIIKNKAERANSHQEEYKAQQALRLTNMAMRGIAHILAVVCKNVKIIKDQSKIIADLNVMGR